MLYGRDIELLKNYISTQLFLNRKSEMSKQYKSITKNVTIKSEKNLSNFTIHNIEMKRDLLKKSTASNSNRDVERKKSSVVSVKSHTGNTTYTRTVQTSQVSSYSSAFNQQDALAFHNTLFPRPGACFSLTQSDNPRQIKTNIINNNEKGEVERYPTKSPNRGTALIINNTKFHRASLDRAGAKKDENDLDRVLTNIGFKVKKYRDQKRNELIKTLDKCSKAMLGDICMVIVMSHGTNDGQPGGYTEVLCSDGNKISTDTVIDYFDECKHQCLKGKPKIFIFQCCRNKIQVDSVPFKINPTSKSNTLIAYSTIPGFAAHRSPKTGSRYIQTLCEVLDAYADTHHMEDLLKIVETKLKKMNDDTYQQVSCYENRGFSKKCYLNPIRN